MLNLIGLKDGKSYLIAKDLSVRINMERLFNKKFKNEIMELEGVWLRKEIIKLGLIFKWIRDKQRNIENKEITY